MAAPADCSPGAEIKLDTLPARPTRFDFGVCADTSFIHVCLCSHDVVAEELRKLHQRKQQMAKGVAVKVGKGVRGGSASGLGKEIISRLLEIFESHNSHKSHIDLIVSLLGGDVRKEQVSGGWGAEGGGWVLSGMVRLHGNHMLWSSHISLPLLDPLWLRPAARANSSAQLDACMCLPWWWLLAVNVVAYITRVLSVLH
jgi:hypothetical protein